MTQNINIKYIEWMKVEGISLRIVSVTHTERCSPLTNVKRKENDKIILRCLHFIHLNEIRKCFT